MRCPPRPPSVPTNSWWRRSARESSVPSAIMRRHNRCCSAQRGWSPTTPRRRTWCRNLPARLHPAAGFPGGCSSLATWMARIAINVAGRCCANSSRSVPLDSHDLDHEPSPEHMMSFMLPRAYRPNHRAGAPELRPCYSSAIEGLPAHFIRNVFIPRAVEMSVDEAAYCLQVKDAVVRRATCARSPAARCAGRADQAQYRKRRCLWVSAATRLCAMWWPSCRRRHLIGKRHFARQKHPLALCPVWPYRAYGLQRAWPGPPCSNLSYCSRS